MKKMLCIMLSVSMLFGFGLVGCSDDVATDEVGNENVEPIVSEESSIYPLTITDDMGNEITIEKKPEKIAALSGTYLALLYQAGGEAIAKSDSGGGSPQPAGTENLPSVGPVYMVNVEEVLSLGADLVIAQIGVQNQVIQLLNESGVPTIALSTRTYDEVIEDFNTIGKIVDNTDGVDKIISEMENKKQTIVENLPEESKKVVILYVTSKEVSVKLENSIAGNVASILELQNVAEGVMPKSMGGETTPFSLEEIISFNPDVIMVTTMVSSKEQAEATIENQIENSPAWSELEAVKSGSIYYLPQKYFLYNPGADFVDGIEYMAKLVYPEIYGSIDE